MRRSYSIGLFATLVMSVVGVACAGVGLTSGDCPGISQPVKSGPGSFDGGDGFTTTQKGPLKLSGAACSGSISDVTVADNWTFEGKANQTISMSVKAVGGSDPNITIIDPDGNVLDFDDDSGGNSDALLVTTLPADGVYTLRVGIYTEGGYTISVKPGTPQ